MDRLKAHAEVFRFVINGLTATLVHFLVLTFNVEYLQLASAGVANFIAATFGITASYLGSRYYVFRKSNAPMLGQAGLFLFVYGLVAILHGLALLLWTDIWGLDYRIGFVIATFFQAVISYLGNKHLVFRQ